MALLIIIFGTLVYLCIKAVNDGDKKNKANEWRESSIRLNELSYWDYSSNCERMVKSGKSVRKLIAHDTDGHPYYYYITRGKERFLAAKYVSGPDVPIKYSDRNIKTWLRNGEIKSVNDLYERWK